MTIWCVIEPEREIKTRRIMTALAAGVPAARISLGRPPVWPAAMVIWGHRWLSETLIPEAMCAGVPWWFVDNGWHAPANGRPNGYYSVTFAGIGPRLLVAPDRKRNPVAMAPWRAPVPDGHVVIALPGPYHGLPLGFDMPAWGAEITRRVRAHTGRRLVIRPKGCERPLAEDLAGAHCLVTHSSKAAVAAVRAGVPVVVDPSSACAPVGGTSLAAIEDPPTPERGDWWASLMCQQFTLAEMADGTAWRWMRLAREEAEAGRAGPPPKRRAVERHPETMGWMA